MIYTKIFIQKYLFKNILFKNIYTKIFIQKYTI